jgi:hypothetical protein
MPIYVRRSSYVPPKIHPLVKNANNFYSLFPLAEKYDVRAGGMPTITASDVVTRPAQSSVSDYGFDRGLSIRVYVSA